MNWERQASHVNARQQHVIARHTSQSLVIARHTSQSLLVLMDQLYLQYLSGHIIIDYILLSQPPTSAAPTHSHISLEFDSVANASIHTIFLIHLCPTYIFVHLLYRSFVYIAICIFIRLGSVKLRVLYSGSPAFDTLRPLGLGCRDLKFKSVKLCC